MATTKTGINTAIAVGDGEAVCVGDGVAVADMEAVDVDEELAPRVRDDEGVLEDDDVNELVVVGVTGGVDDDVDVRVPDGVADGEVELVELLESETVGVCETRAAMD